MNPVTLFSLIASNPLTRKSIKKLIERDGRVTKLEKFLNAYLRGENVDGEFRILQHLIESGLKSFGADKAALREKLQNSYWRRGFISVLRGIAEFGISRPFIPGAPFLVVWDVTYACNLRCRHCYSTSGKPWKDELSTSEAIRAIDVLADAGVTAIAFSGGEPLLRKDFFELARHASRQGMYVAVATNGILITRDVAEKMKECGIGFVQISLDGRKVIHDKFRGIKGIYEKVIQGILNARDAGLVTCISTTATALNFQDIEKVMDLAEELGVGWFMLYNFIPAGRGSFEMDLSAEERERLLRELWRRTESTGINFMSTAPYYARMALQSDSQVIPTHFYNPELKGDLKKLAEFIGGCGCGRFYIAMRANGDIEPCVFFPLKLANIMEFGSGEDFLMFWRENRILKELRNKDRIEICGKCRYRYVCGGCRARAYAYFRDYLKPDPGCVIVSRILEQRVEA